MTRRFWLLRGLLFVGLSLAIFASMTFAQDGSQVPIRVDSNLVVARAVVFDKKHMDNATDKERQCIGAELTTFYNLPLTQSYIPKPCWALEVRDLSARDFHLWVDGVEQRIQTVTHERSNILVRDNQGAHFEYSDTPAGKWSTIEIPPPPERIRPSVGENFYYFYNIVFAPDTSVQAGCHEIKTTVDRSNSVVYYRPEYCAGQTPYDTLIGTKFGKQIESQLATGEPGTIPLSLQSGFFHTSAHKARLWLAVEFPQCSLHRHWEKDWALHATIGAVGFISSEDGSLATRFSDLACCSEYSTTRIFGISTNTFESVLHPAQDSETDQLLSQRYKLEIAGIEAVRLPTRYETQLDLPPGKYDLRLVLSDGETFGRAEIHFEIADYDGKELALSSVMLGKRIQDAHVAAVESGAAENFASQYVPIVSKGIQVAPTGDSLFKQGEHMFGYVEINEPLLSSAPTTTVQAHLRVVDAKTGEVRKDFGNVDATPYINRGSTVIPIGREIPFQSLPSGSYRLEVQAIDSAGQTTPWQTADFIVEQLAASNSAAIAAQAPENSPCLVDWPCLLPEKVLHGRTVKAQLTFDERADNSPGIVKIKIGVDQFGDVATMKVLSGDKALVKDAKSFLVKTKFPKAPDQNRDPMTDWPNRDDPAYSQPFYGGLRSQVYAVLFSTPTARPKP